MQPLKLLLPNLDKQTVDRQLLPFALGKAKLTESVATRCLACQLLGLVLSRVPSDEVRNSCFLTCPCHATWSTRSFQITKCAPSLTWWHAAQIQKQLKLLKALCQDLSQDVRQAACSHLLTPVIKVLGPAVSGSLLLDDLLELVKVRGQLVPTHLYCSTAAAGYT